MTRDTTRRRPTRRDDDRDSRPDPAVEVPLVPETTTHDDDAGSYRASPFELALMEDSE